MKRILPLSEVPKDCLGGQCMSIQMLPHGMVLLDPTPEERELCDLFAAEIQRLHPGVPTSVTGMPESGEEP